GRGSAISGRCWRRFRRRWRVTGAREGDPTAALLAEPERQRFWRQRGRIYRHDGLHIVRPKQRQIDGEQYQRQLPRPLEYYDVFLKGAFSNRELVAGGAAVDSGQPLQPLGRFEPIERSRVLGARSRQQFNQLQAVRALGGLKCEIQV